MISAAIPGFNFEDGGGERGVGGEWGEKRIVPEIFQARPICMFIYGHRIIES